MGGNTGSGRCQRCQGEVFLVRNELTGQIVRLDPYPSESGRWHVRISHGGVYLAEYDPKPRGDQGYRGHDLQCMRSVPTYTNPVLGTMTEGATR